MSKQNIPNEKLQSLDRLVGDWEIEGPDASGKVNFQWMSGNFFMVQQVDIKQGGMTIVGVEYIGYDEETDSLKSHYFDNHGNLFNYFWELKEDNLKIWFGTKNSENRYEGTFIDDGNTNTGAWEWPGGGYESKMKRAKSAN